VDTLATCRAVSKTYPYDNSHISLREEEGRNTFILQQKHKNLIQNTIKMPISYILD
jgi:hypothetical protein